MQSHWFKNAVIYCLEVDVFNDGNGDGIGDFIGLRQGLSYLAGLGVSCLWLLPFFKSPDRDDGYDVMDYLSVDPALGDLGDFAAFMDEAQDRGIRVIIDLVVNHTSNQHPWFQRARKRDPEYYDYYVWRSDSPGDTSNQVAFPGKQKSVWQYDKVAKAYYFHRFYSYQPDLNTANPAVRQEIKKIMGFWAAMGVSGFRVDAAPFVIAAKGADADKHPHESYEFLQEFREFLRWKTGDAILLAEANVPPEQLTDFFGPAGNRMNMLLNFYVNPHLFLAIAQQSPEPIVRSLRALPQIPADCHWAYFLRNHDELDLSRLAEAEQEECFRAFAPKKEMQLYGRGIRRRLAPMFDGDIATALLAFSLIFTIPGTPVLWYGEEIGMGEDLSLEERNSVRTPMQWSAERNGGFSKAPKELLRRPVISKGKFSYRNVNVQKLRRQPESLLNRLELMIRTRKEFPEFGTGAYRILETDRRKTVFAHSCEDEAGRAVLAAHNLSDQAEKVTIQLWHREFDHFVYLFEERENEPISDGTIALKLPPRGFSWLRLVAA
ncbi:MAG: alpha-amylase family protein [Verrucomicrobia bacterium]|nr:alpha-amylase family protein [Verrucomicrobiota bacterium]MBV8376254.1 alpha-amylase family protein [Verrucomicrobiota bacterium]